MTRISILGAVACAACLSSGLPAGASSTDWFETEGGRVRLVTTGLPDAQGRLTGVLDIALLPGWKTYWRDPGDAGVPPTLDITRSADLSAVEILYPAPGRHDEGDFTWAGYDRPVALPVTFQAAQVGSPVQIDADAFLGICETICIPVKAEFVLDPASDPDNEDDRAVVEAALSALPAPASADFGARVVSHADGRLVVEAHVPGDPEAADIFIAGNDDYTFATPRRSIEDGKLLFSVEMDGPAAVPPETALHYTLVAASGAVNGVLAPK